MDIPLSQNFEKILKEKVSSGLFASVEEAVSFAIKFTFTENKISEERIAKFNAEIEKGIKEMEAGKGRPYKEIFAELRKRYI